MHLTPNESTENAIYNFQQFVKLLQEIIMIFYKIDDLKAIIPNEYYLFTKENIVDFVTKILFVEQIQVLFFKTYQNQELKNDMEYLKTFNKFKTNDIKFFGVPDKFCLNEETIRYFNNEKKSQKTQKIDQNLSLNYLFKIINLII